MQLVQKYRIFGQTDLITHMHAGACRRAQVRARHVYMSIIYLFCTNRYIYIGNSLNFKRKSVVQKVVQQFLKL